MTFFGSLFAKKGVGLSAWEKKYGGIYDGEMLNGLPHGYGTFIGSCKIIVRKGYWRYGNLHGQGRTEIWDDKNASLDGDCPYYWEGIYVNGKLNGKGVRLRSLGRYEGDFVDGKEHGQGEFELYHGNTVYKGEFKNGMAHGEGTIVTKDGLVLYSGEWKRNCPVNKIRTSRIPTAPDQAVWSENIHKYIIED